MGIIEGTYGPILVAGTPGAGTTKIDTLTIDAAGGTFKLGFEDWVSPAISWSATNTTLVNNVNAALQGSAEVQTITFAGTLSGAFRLRFRGQETAPITWSATNNTLRDNVDAALEALVPIGTAGVVTAVGTMTSGVGTLTVTFAEFGPQLALSVSDNRTGGTITVARTTPGVQTPIGKIGVVAAVDSMTAGVGTLSLTYSGTTWAKRAGIPSITVENNSLTGTATLTVTEATPGVDADGRGAAIGASAVDTTNGKAYQNTGTAILPTWTLTGSQS